MTRDTNTAVTIPPLSLSAQTINTHHNNILEHGKGMLREAKAAGEELLRVKKALKHGEFKPWIEENCSFSYSQAKRYMQIAKRIDVEPFDPEASIESILHTKGKPKAHLQSFSQTDAEYAQKLHAMAVRGTEHEREVAKGKLEAFAKSFGKTPEKLMEHVGKKDPQPQSVTEITIQETLEPFRSKSKDDLLMMLLHCMVKHPDLVADLKGEAQWR
ncbi:MULTISPECIES: DUF3102 domain-containing protein [unclassified Thalassospira]|jgi:hypothetical protein|uniref:DUF3102 domain-containing protein n=1 Tax=unclassified Thalassospira TaxID=2648997 RepID=UPI0007A5C7CE|nr:MULTISPECIES: DUF3102 domain-containing protein [unclassified Thalassospira]KZD02285.1 hypothetical protein AUQ41_02255 [Thalassospira sp. MCCC 1A02898]ONH89418.1 hypothetical protein TH47_04440 [Thalassospira sp. MCCC 1A02803]